MIPIGAILLRLEPHLKGYLRVYQLGAKFYTVYMTERAHIAHELNESPHRTKALELLKKRVTVTAPDDSRKPCQ